MLNTKLVPWQRLNELFDDSLFQNDAAGVAAPLDIVESDDGYQVTLDLPGVAPEDVHVEFKEGRLWISGERNAEAREEGKKYHRLERRWGSFRRVVGMPEDVASDQIEADFQNGVLHVVLPKSETAQPKKIEIRTS